ncbi:hypothetical protein Dehly_1546 [Dehalogenimonas lykanthroporepellens BL-DC-9]|nr:hypothetical protein Dehly_1546 [Dehalogenimonas lykanthroporepellens BL-DC-9]
MNQPTKPHIKPARILSITGLVMLAIPAVDMFISGPIFGLR